MRRGGLVRGRSVGRIGQGANLGEQVELEESCMELYYLPVFRRKRLDVDGEGKGWIDVDGSVDLEAIGQAQSTGKSSVEFHDWNLLLAARYTTSNAIATNNRGDFSLAGQACPAEIYRSLGIAFLGRLGVLVA